MPARKIDYWISYNHADEDWAVWIAWVLEAAGYTVTVQAWDFRPGSNFVVEMDGAARQASRTIAVLSSDYISSRFTPSEWAAAFASDPMGSERRLLPVRVRDFPRAGLLSQIVSIDLVGLSETAATKALLAGVKEGRAKPKTPPRFPSAAPRPVPEHPPFPPRQAKKTAGTSSAKASPSSRPSAAAPAVIKTSGPLVLLQNGFYTAASVDEARDGTVSVRVKPGNAEEDAALRSLCPERSGRPGPLAYAYQNDGFIARVEACECQSAGGKAFWTITLQPERGSRGRDITESAYRTGNVMLSADDIAALRARWLLLAEPPRLQGGADSFLMSLVRGGQGIQAGIFPPLWQEFKGSKERFLRCARLWAVFNLLASSTCERVLELALGPIERHTMKVRFRGQRHKVYSNEPAATIAVEGQCRLKV